MQLTSTVDTFSGAEAVAWSASTVKVDGNNLAMIRAVAADKNMATTYKTKIGFNLALAPCWWRAIEADTKTKTNSGAIAFKADTNKSPNRKTKSWPSGNTRAKSIPKTMPMTICKINGILLKNLKKLPLGSTACNMKIS